MTVVIHNIDDTGAGELNRICRDMYLAHEEHITFLNEGLHYFKITISEDKMVPFLMRFMHRIDKDEYESMVIS